MGDQCVVPLVSMMDISAFPFLVGIFAVLVVAYLTTVVLRESVGTPRMAQIADYIRIGTKAYLSRQFRTIAWFIPALALILFYFLGWKTAFTFILGALLSLLVAYIGMKVAVIANVRTANAASCPRIRIFFGWF